MAKKQKATKYDDIRGSLLTFDVLNCKTGKWSWNPVKLIANIIWYLIGHTAMVYRCHETDQLFVYESTQSGRADKLSGVQLRPMREWLLAYQKVGTVSVRRMNISGLAPGMINIYDKDARPTLRYYAEAKCREHIKKYRGTGYPNLKTKRGRWFVLNSALDLPGIFGKLFKNKMTQTPKVMFCTMLYIHCIMFCGLVLRTNTNPAEWEPDDTLDTSNDLPSELTRQVSIGPDIRIEV